MKIGDRQLALLRAEYETSKKYAEQYLHRPWAHVMREFRFHTGKEFHDALVSRIEYYLSSDSFHAADGRFPSLNIKIRKLLSLLTSRQPDFTVEHTNPGDEAIAWVVEQGLASELHKQRIARKERLWVLDALFCGIAVSKVNYSSREVYAEEAWTGRAPKETVDANPDDDEWPFRTMTEYANDTADPGGCYLGRVSPFDVFPDPGVRDADSVRRIYMRSWRPVADIHRDERYLKKARMQVTGTCMLEDDIRLRNLWDRDFCAECEWAEVVECFDLGSNMYCSFHEHIDMPLRHWQDMPLDVKNPYAFWRPIETPDSFWGVSLGVLMLPSTRNRNTMRSLVIDHANFGNKRVNIWDADVFQDEDMMRINQARDRENIFVPGISGRDPNSYHHVVEFGDVNPAIRELADVFRNDEDEISGLNDPTLNRYRGEMSATEANLRGEQQQLNIQDARDTFEEFLEESVANYARVMLQFWPKEKLMKIVGPDPKIEFWVPVVREAVLREFTLRIHPGSTERLDSATYRRQLIDLAPRIAEIKQMIDMDTMNQMQGMPPSPVNMTEFLRSILESFDRRLVEKIMQPRDPMTLLQRLMQQHGLIPTYVSPDLSAMIAEKANREMAQALGIQQSPTPTAGAGGPPSPSSPDDGRIVSFPERSGVPAPAALQFGQNPLNFGGNMTGRMLSEAAPGGR